MNGSTMFLRLGGKLKQRTIGDRIEERIYNKPEQVYEVVRLPIINWCVCPLPMRFSF